jgi:hypothetical protein
MQILFALLTIFIFFASVVAIFIAVLIFSRKEPHKELKMVHVFNHKIISEEEAKKYEIENYETIDNVIFVYYVKRG